MKLILINILIVAGVLACFFYLGRYEVVVVDSLALNVRTGPGMTYDIQAQAKKGQELTILEEKKQWYHVRLADNSTGWIASWLVSKGDSSPATNIQATVNTNDTKLRSSGNVESEIVDTLANGTAVVITSEQNGWSNVEYKKKTGWIHSELLTVKDEQNEEPSKEKYLYAREDETKIRSLPSIDGEIVSTLKYGEKVTYNKLDGDWYEVETPDGKQGYIANWVVSYTSLDEGTKKAATSIAEATIVLDPGHGGVDPGAESNNGKNFEKDITLSTALMVKADLEKLGANVILTREKDTDVSLNRRTQISNEAAADVFISFHYDSTDEPNVGTGTTTYFYNDKDEELAKLVNTELASDLPLDNRGYMFQDYQVLRDNQQPALLLELGYMNNDQDFSEAKTKNYQKKVAKAVTSGLKAYFN